MDEGRAGGGADKGVGRLAVRASYRNQNTGMRQTEQGKLFHQL